jgi:hypothetical protein
MKRLLQTATCAMSAAAILVLGTLLPTAGTAAIIIPTSYAYTGGTPAGESGFSSYDDPALSKLTDGNTGSPNTGDGTWIGWQHGDSGAAQILFNFASSATITNVAFHFLRSDNANTQLPDSVTIGGINFPTADFATDDTMGFVSYSGSWTGNSLAVSLNHVTSHWMFINEAQFTTGAGVAAPEPATLTVAGLSLGGLLFARRRRGQAVERARATR